VEALVPNITRLAGCRMVELIDPEMGMAFPMVVMYPAGVSGPPEQPEQLGPYTLDVAMGAPVAAGVFPLVVISHGTGGSHLLYRTLARHLARNGFVVAMPEHPRNNRNNNDLVATAANLENRPRHIRIAIDWAFSSGGFGDCLAACSAVVGHSLGGYTALAIAGGRPTAFPHESPDRLARPVQVTPDERVKALVLLAPATAWFKDPDALSSVRIPILMLTAEKDEHTTAWHAGMVKEGVPDKSVVEHRTVPNAGHFSFLSPFPDAMKSASFPPSQDPEGFDREGFHAEMNDEILAFLLRNLHV
jgi:predicted dienelactone hydrolase